MSQEDVDPTRQHRAINCQPGAGPEMAEHPPNTGL